MSQFVVATVSKTLGIPAFAPDVVDDPDYQDLNALFDPSINAGYI